MNSPSNHTIATLSSIDHIFTGIGSYPIEFIFSYKVKLNEKTLRSSLKETIKHFPPISSMLVKLSENEYGFKLSSKGIVFDVRNSDLGFEENDNKYEYINPVNTIEGNPLTKIRITHTPGGSVLGVSISHAIADGFSYFHFLSSWAKLFHGKPFYPPVHQRSLLVSKGYDGHKDPISSKEIFNEAGLFLESKRDVIKKEDLKWESRLFKNEELKQLLSESQKTMDIRLSYNDIVTAQLSKEYLIKWQKPDQNDLCFISCPVDFRRILDGFPKTYFGNAVSLASTSLKYSNLETLSISELALRIRTKVKSVDKEYINGSLSALTALRVQKNVNIFENVHVMHPNAGLLVTNLSRLPVHEIEFNAGKPVDFSILTQTVRGAVVLPHPAGIEVRICCPIN